jgi:hypothetical protein
MATQKIIYVGEPIINPIRFVQATRDSGYRSLDAALSELIDNSLQAGATLVQIFTPESDILESDSLAVLDNGCGMGPEQLSIALQFGGSERFNDRSSLGRYGMGLPNSSLSQARRVEVYSWRGETIWYSYLDLDEVLTTESPLLPAPSHCSCLPTGFDRYRCGTGTLVIWKNLDKGKPLRWGTATKRLTRRLGQIFRYYLWDGHDIVLDNLPIPPFDPLFLSARTRTPWILGKPYGDPLVYEFAIGTAGKSSKVEVRFSELPINELTDLPNIDKRNYGITGGAGVSIVRAGRELEHGWILLDKRRENYDDWWRCEIRFQPELDELFGVTHTKQGIRPAETLRRILVPELGELARTLNRRVRLSQVADSAEREKSASARLATKREALLTPVPIPEFSPAGISQRGLPRFAVLVEELSGQGFQLTEYREGQLTVILNKMHAFYRSLYFPIMSDSTLQNRQQLELFLMALARTQVQEWTAAERETLERFFDDWSKAQTAFLGGDGAT